MPRREWAGSSRFLSDLAEAERAFALADQLGSVNAAAAELGTTWPSLRKAFTCHGLGMPARNPEAVRQRAVAVTNRRAGQRAAPPLDPVFVVFNAAQLPHELCEVGPAWARLPASWPVTISTPPPTNPSADRRWFGRDRDTGRDER